LLLLLLHLLLLHLLLLHPAAAASCCCCCCHCYGGGCMYLWTLSGDGIHKHTAEHAEAASNRLGAHLAQYGTLT
jgi:hypothetical protein